MGLSLLTIARRVSLSDIIKGETAKPTSKSIRVATIRRKAEKYKSKTRFYNCNKLEYNACNCNAEGKDTRNDKH